MLTELFLEMDGSMRDGSTSFERKNQTILQRQPNTSAANMRRVGDVVNQFFLPGEEPELFAGVPDFPRYGLAGRHQLLAHLIGQLTTGGAHSFSTSGKGGVGKTALAVAVAHHKDLLAHFSDGVLWASLGPHGDPLLELSRWAEALSLDPAQYPKPGALKRVVKNAIGQRKLLLVLDDIWDAGQAVLLRCGGPFCAHLLTAREKDIATGFAGSRENTLNVPNLKPDPAFTLLQTIAEDAVAAGEKAAQELLQRVGGLPLAVELLGGFLSGGGAPDPRVFPELDQERPQEPVDPSLRLKQAKVRLEANSGEGIKLDDLMALSLDGYDEDQTNSFYALGTFAPQPALFSRAAAEAVSAADGPFLCQLVNRNLLKIEGKALALHRTLHRALCNRVKSRLIEAARLRHADYYLALVNADRNNWRRIDDAYEQIRWAWERADDDASLPWAWALWPHQSTRGLLWQCTAFHVRALAWVRESGDGGDEAKLLINLGWVDQISGRSQEALHLYQQALPISREMGDRTAEVTALNNMGEVYRASGQPQEALRFYEETLSISREVGDRAAEATALNNMGLAYRAIGRTEEALRLYEEALPIRREVGDRAGEATTLNNMGLAYRATWRPEEALRLYEEALPIRREVGDRTGEAATLNNMAGSYYATGRTEEALRLYEEALLIDREMGDRTGEATTLNNMGEVSRATGRPEEALRLYEEALPIIREVGDRAGEATTLWNVTFLLKHLERMPEALQRVEEAIALFRDGLAHDSAGDTVEKYQELLQKLQEEMDNNMWLNGSINFG